MTVKLIWYDMDSEKGTDIIRDVKDVDEAVKRGYEKYNGNPPAKMYSAIVME